jgi:hypothetical protein
MELFREIKNLNNFLKLVNILPGRRRYRVVRHPYIYVYIYVHTYIYTYVHVLMTKHGLWIDNYIYLTLKTRNYKWL